MALKRWTGNWRYTSPFTGFYGRNGTLTVEAGTDYEAEREIQNKASRSLIGSTMYNYAIRVSDLKEEPVRR